MRVTQAHVGAGFVAGDRNNRGTLIALSAMLAALAIAETVVSGTLHQAEEVETFPVSGRLFVRHQLAPGAYVVFHPVDPSSCQGRCAVALTNADGSFSLSTHQKNDGAPAGDYIVTVIWPDYACPIDECEVTEMSKHDRLRGKFADPATSPLFATVLPEGNYMNLSTSGIEEN